MPTATQVKQIILDLYSNEREDWIRKARRVAHEIARNKGQVCADDIHEQCPIPNGLDRRIMGTVFDGMKCIGYHKSRRKINHKRPIGYFTL